MSTNQNTPSVRPYSPTDSRVPMTDWLNPTEHRLRVVVDAGVPAPAAHYKRDLREFSWEPGSVAAMYDTVIQVVRNGRIEGGRAPQLQRVGGPVLPLHPALLPIPDPTLRPADRRRV